MRKVFERKADPRDIVEVREVNGNKLTTAIGIYVNEEKNAQVVCFGTSDMIMNAIVNLTVSLMSDIKLPRGESRMKLLEEMYCTIKCELEKELAEKKEEKKEVDPEIEEFEKKLDDLLSFLQRKNKEFEEARK